MAVFDLEAVIRLNDQGFKSGLSKAGKVIGTFAKAAGVAVAAGATAVTVLVKQAVDAYGEYEQLVGGIETLYGTGGRSLAKYAEDAGKTTREVAAEWWALNKAQATVLKNSEQAYETAGLSASEYMNTAINFSGALLKSLGGDTTAAADKTDMAIRDMADQANKYGRTVEEVSQTYTSLARGNTQTLDNLFGGMFAGTKKGLRDMLDYAEQYQASLGNTVKYSEDSYADIVQAIHDVSEATGVYGTTAAEAAGTIQGSVNMTKAAWRNLVRAFGQKDADLSKYFDNLVTSAETAFNNILPVAERAIKGIGQMVTDLAPVIGEKLPGLISSVLPDLVKSGASLVAAVLTGFATALPDLVAAIPDILTALKDGFVDSWPALKEAGGKLLDMVGEGLKAAGPALMKLGGQIMEKLGPVFSDAWTNIKNTAEKYLPGITSLMSQTWSMISSGAKKAWKGITTVFGDAWTTIRGVFGEHSGQLAQGMSNIWEGIKNRWQGALNGLSSFWNTWGNTITTLGAGIWEQLRVGFENGLTVISDVFSIFSSVFAGDWAGAWEGIKQLGSDIWTGIGDQLSATWDTISNTAKAAWEAIKNGEFWEDIKTKASETWEGIKTGASKKWGEIKDSVAEKWEIIKNGGFWPAVGEKVQGMWGLIKKGVGPAWNGIKGAVGEAWEKVKSGPAWTSISNKATEAWSSFKGTVSGAWNGVKSAVITAWNGVKNGPAWTSISAKAKSAWSSIESGVSGAFDGIKRAVEEAWKKVTEVKLKLPDILLGALPKLPKISISGSFSIFPPSAPTITWNAKAMKNPYMFTDMTLFGAGEAGDEVLYGKTALMTDIRAGVASETDGLTQNLTAILEELRSYLPELARRPVVLDSGALVGGIGYDMDRQLGGYSDMGGRELSLA